MLQRTTLSHSFLTFRSDFAIPPSLILQLSKSPTPLFFTSYSLEALPQLNGSISYITSSIPLAGVSSGDVTRLESFS